MTTDSNDTRPATVATVNGEDVIRDRAATAENLTDLAALADACAMMTGTLADTFVRATARVMYPGRNLHTDEIAQLLETDLRDAFRAQEDTAARRAQIEQLTMLVTTYQVLNSSTRSLFALVAQAQAAERHPSPLDSSAAELAP